MVQNKLSIYLDSLKIVIVLNLSRYLLIVFLVLLQLIAPLVHAHAGKQLLGCGVHLPGLELYELNQPDSLLMAVQGNIDLDAMFVGVNTGIERQYSITSDNTETFAFIATSVPMVTSDRLSATINFSPHDVPVFAYRPHVSSSPRAPPPQ